MALKVVTIPATFTPFTFTFVVPGNEQWTLRSVRADIFRSIGGTPNRAYSLTVTDGTSTVAQAGAPDAGTEPGQTSITWCDCPAGSVAAGSDGVVVAPLPNLILQAGYVIEGDVLNGVIGDAWLDALVWCDYVDTNP